jgi:hypothetical protein
MRKIRKPREVSPRRYLFVQPPSDRDFKEARLGINIVIGASDKKVYFYNRSGQIGKPVKLKEFLKGC